MSVTFAILAASLLRFLDPWTCIYQTDEASAPIPPCVDCRESHWPIPNGLLDPLAKNVQPRIIHTFYRVSDERLKDYDPEQPSPLFKVNQVGYLPNAPKFAYLGAWLGPDFGAWKPRVRMEGWQLVNAQTGDVVLDSETPPLLRVQDGKTKEGVPFTGEDTYEMEFSSVVDEGEYFIRIKDVGRSENFRIVAEAAEAAFRVHMGGLYQKRCGIAKAEPYTHWTAGACHTNVIRGSFAPDEGTLDPKVKWFDIIRDNTPWEDGESLHIVGGWHDAADYDRRPMHLNIVNDLCAVYLMRSDNFRDGQLLIPENENGIPDILDEAEWGLRHLIQGQQQDGGVGTWIESVAHPGPGNVADKDTMPYALAKATRRSSLMYAAHAALLARCNPVFLERYLESAKRAWIFATTTNPRREIFEVKRKHHRIFTTSEIVYWEEDEELPDEYLVKAAVNLYALTDDRKYIETVLRDKSQIIERMKKNAWRWPMLLFSGEHKLGIPKALAEFVNVWEKRTLNMAKGICGQMESAYAYRAPWWAPQTGWVHTMGFGNSHPLRRAQFLIAAHAITGDAKFLDAAAVANDFHNGCNPQGATLTSGLGVVYPIAFLDLPSYVDGIEEYVPGITPYRWTYGLNAKAVEMVWGGDKAYASKWPIWRRWANLENQTVAASEYTVWETIAPAASVSGYLITPGDKHSVDAKSISSRRPAPVKSLPGYWPLP